MMRCLLAAMLLLAGLAAPPAHATMALVEGWEAQSTLLSCNGTNPDAVINTTNKRSGAASLALTHGASTARGSCTLKSAGWNLTGTVWVFGVIRIDNPTTCTNIATGAAILDFGEVTLQDACATSGNSHTISVKENGSSMGSDWTGLNDATGTWYPVAIKIVTGAGSGSVSWRVSTDGQNWTDQGTSSSRTISNVDQLVVTHPQVLSGTSFMAVLVDDLVVMTGSGLTWPDPRTFVNLRAGKASTPTYNEWTKVGGTNIYDANVWPSRTGLSAITYSGTCTAGSNAGAACKADSECPSSVCAGWAVSPQSDGGGNQAEQTMKLAAWDSGTPTPTIPASATGVNKIWGCQWRTVVGRTTSTNRSYALRYAWNSTPSDTSISLSAETYTNQVTLLELGGTPSTDLSTLNTLEVGGVRTSTASGANMVIRDHWVECAWSEAAQSGAMMWVQDED